MYNTVTVGPVLAIVIAHVWHFGRSFVVNAMIIVVQFGAAFFCLLCLLLLWIFTYAQFFSVLCSHSGLLFFVCVCSVHYTSFILLAITHNYLHEQTFCVCAFVFDHHEQFSIFNNKSHFCSHIRIQ